MLPFPLVLFLLLHRGVSFSDFNKFPEEAHYTAIGSQDFSETRGRSKEPGKSDENNARPSVGRGGKRDIRRGKEEEGGSARRKLHGKSQPLKEAFPCTDGRGGDLYFSTVFIECDRVVH